MMRAESWENFPHLPPVRITDSNSGGNREQRRREKRMVGHEFGALAGEVNLRTYNLVSAGKEWGRVVSPHEGNLGSIIFRGRPFIIPLLQASRDFSLALDRWHISNEQTGSLSVQTLAQFDSNDFYSYRVGQIRRFWFTLYEGTSLKDIEQMNLNPHLSSDDIWRINRIFTSSWSFKDYILGTMLRRSRPIPATGYDSAVRESILYFVTQPVARPEGKINIPDELKPLRDRLTDYFEYYKDLLLDFDLTLEAEKYLLNAFQRMNPLLPQFLGYYIVASSGVTPSSAIKLFQTRAEAANLYRFIWNRSGLYNLEAAAKDSYRTNRLPPDLARFQHLDTQMDEKASRLLTGYYQTQRLSKEDIVEAFDSADQSLDKLTNLYWKAIDEDIARAPQKRLKLTFPDNHIIAGLTLTCQNKQTLICILHLQDGQTYLTLEIDKNQKYYGLPSKLALDDRGFDSLILKDVFNQLLVQVQLRHPEVEKNYQKSPLIVSPSIFQPAPDFHPAKAGPKMPTSRKATILRIFNQEPVPPKRQEFGRRVIYSRIAVVDVLKGHPSKEIVDSVIDAMEEYQRGERQAKMIKWSGGKRLVLLVGNLRIILNPLGGGRSAFEYVADREEVYEGYGDHKVR